MKNIKNLLTALLLLCSTVSSAYDFKVGGICYNITNAANRTVEVASNSSRYSGNVTIPETVTHRRKTYRVTSIGGYAFKYCSVTSIEIPNSVKSIGEEAFRNCSALTSIKIPNSVTSIGNSAFRNCSGLTSIVIPSSVISIGESAFYGCSELKNVEINCASVENWFSRLPSIQEVVLGDGVTSIGDYAFLGCTALTNIVIPNSVTSIGNSAFRNCSALTSIEIPNSVKSIGEEAFRNCSALTSIVIPNSVTRIRMSAFEGCSGLTSIVIPNSVTRIGNYAFKGCSRLKSVVIPNNVTSIGSGAFKGCSGLKSIEIPNSVTRIGNYAFEDCSGLKSVIIPNSVTSIGSYAFSDCSSLKTVINLSSLTLRKGSSSNGYVAYYADKVINAPNGCIDGDFVWGKINGVNTLVAYLGGASKLTLPTDYNGGHYIIGESAFSGCSGLARVTIPNSVKSIDDNAFAYCTGLTSVTIGTSVTEIGYDAFYSCNLKKAIWLTNTPPTGYENVGAAINYVANEQYTNFDNVEVYPYLSSLFEVGGVKYVPVSPAERTCNAIDCSYSNVADIVIDDKVMFKGIAMSVEEVMPYTLYGNKNIKSLKLNNCGGIGNYAISTCSNLTSVTIGDNVTSIGSGAFSSCKNLESVTIPDCVSSVEDAVFMGCCALKSVMLGNGVEYIGEKAFSGCSSLKGIKIPCSVYGVGDYAFDSCSSLVNVVFEDGFAELWLGSNGSAPLFGDSPLDSVYIGRKITYETSGRCGYSPFYRNTSLRTVVVTDAETEICDNEFYGCSNLKNISVGNGITRIGNWAFSGCSSLDCVVLGENVASVGEEAFSDCANVTRILSKAKTPPTCGKQALDDINKWECILSVPNEAKSKYQAAGQWRDFFFIEDLQHP